MIIWLASYPRSGNTILRMMLKTVFGLETYSKYNDLQDISGNQEMIKLTGHKRIHDNWGNAYHKMKQSSRLFFVKTHDFPEDDSRAIYIVRDGRASTVSYCHYLKDYESKECSVFDVVTGIVNFGSWGAHLDAWDPVNRHDTLLVQYERLLTAPEEEIVKISDFLGLNTVGDWNNDFEFFHKIEPQFFREGQASKEIDGIQDEDLDIFWLLHGDWMEALGYAAREKRVSGNASRLRKITGRISGKLLDHASLEASRESLLNSLSWRVTAPLRTVWKIFKKIKLLPRHDN